MWLTVNLRLSGSIWSIRLYLRLPRTASTSVPFHLHLHKGLHKVSRTSGLPIESFEIRDIVSGLPYPDETFDVVHVRDLISGVRAGPDLPRRALALVDGTGRY